MRLRPHVSTDPARYAFGHRLRVRFAETDAMGVAHHAAYLPYLEEARVEWLRRLGHPYDQMRADGVDLAVVEAWVGYRRSLRFDDLVDIHLAVAWTRPSTLQLDYLVRHGRDTVAVAATVHGATDAAGRATRLPGWLADLVPPGGDGAAS